MPKQIWIAADYEKTLIESHLRSFNTYSTSIPSVGVWALPSNKVGTTELVSLDLWPSTEMSLLSTVFLVFGHDLFFPSSRSDLTLESPSILQASSRTKPRNAASIFDGASRTDVHKK